MAASFAQTLYVSKAWTDLRFRLIMERGPVCQRCGKIIANTSQLAGHHIKPLTPANINDVMVTLNPDNVDLVCFHCHNLEHRRFGYHRQSVYIVYGSPLTMKAGLFATANPIISNANIPNPIKAYLRESSAASKPQNSTPQPAAQQFVFVIIKK